MRRSKNSPEPSARGNFTPPQREAVAPAPMPGNDPAPAGGGGRLSPRNWRVPVRLNAILLIPALVALVMGGFQVKGSIDTWSEAQDAEKTALVVRAAADYSQALLNERDLSAPDLLQSKGETDQVKKLRDATAEAKAKFDAAVADMPANAGLERRLKLFQANEGKLADVRKKAYTRSQDPLKTEEAYTDIQHFLMEFANELSLGSGNVTSYGRTVYAVSLAKASASLQRSIGTHILVRPSQNPKVLTEQLRQLSTYRYLESIAIGEYVSGGSEEDVAALESEMAKQQKATGVEADGDTGLQSRQYSALPAMDITLTKMAAAFQSDDPRGALQKDGINAKVWLELGTAKMDGYGAVETDLIDKAVSDAAQISSDAKTDAYVNGAIVVAALLAAFIIAGLMARQMSRSMRRLRTAAFDVAEQRLPMLVDQLSRTEPGRVDTRVQPIPISSTDEIGEVARAFDQVHREAVRLAAEQALLRGNINAIFTNLSRRNQSLIEGQLTLITDLENNEADPDQLENLFRLDHLATRMRRNGENLLVLAGEEPGRRWDQPVPLVDVLRAASSEVEQYERIELTGVPEAEIHGRAVTDLVHLLAELLENATTFSSPQTKVRVTATRLPDGRVMIEIHDKGIGLTAEDFADINHKLANPPTVDAAISQRMGLFVVGRLADRHGVRVQLRPSGEQAGTTSLVMLPDVITHGGGGSEVPESEFTVSQMIPQQQSYETGGPAPLRTAAELGFDDSRYEQQALSDEAVRELDPVGRSLMREERRAALEAQAADQNGRPLFRDEVGQDGYDQQGAYPQQDGYPGEQGYADQGAYAQSQNGYDQQDAYEPVPQGAYAQQDGYQDTGYAEPGYADRSGAQQDGYGDYNGQADWQNQGGYQEQYADGYGAEAESAPDAPAADRDGVGFDGPGTAGPSPSVVHETTEAGLPRRGTAGGGNGQQWQGGSDRPQDQGALPQRPLAGGPQPSAPQADGGSESRGLLAGGSGSGSDDWQSANDVRWQRAEQLKQPRAGGVTSSGLPRRVPRANLVEGTAEQTPQGGPQVSRAPEDVRGRLSNLRRGVQRGRDAGNETNGQGFGSGSNYNQER
ncbi:sensor histidine kinase [Streptomyces indicus]|uniref:histidine kinase n=1 Tax=Streptomyces indicus TaxID=417292 RepID=A0A1G8W1R0_9ACTN|nr:sensor histidine kinase [Streptomyces indicus]SDJ72262.1 Signal transduction histidine kinase [Streptomyces indicus]